MIKKKKINWIHLLPNHKIKLRKPNKKIIRKRKIKKNKKRKRRRQSRKLDTSQPARVNAHVQDRLRGEDEKIKDNK